MKKFLNIAAIAAVAMMGCACNQEAMEPDSDDWKDVPTEEELTDCIYFKDGSFTTATVDFTVSRTEFTYTVLRKSENKLECTADIRSLTEEELAAEGNYYVLMPEEYYEVTSSVAFTDNDEAGVKITFKPEKASEVAEFITSSRDSEKTPCIAIKLDVTGDTGIEADRKSGFLIISWSYENADFCRLAAEAEGAEVPVFIGLDSYTDLPSVSVKNISSYKVNINRSSGNIVGEIKVAASFDEETAREYAEGYGYEPLPSDALTSDGEITLTSENTSGLLTFSIDKSKLTGHGLYIAAVSAAVVSDNAEIEGNSTFLFLVESPVTYDGLWREDGEYGEGGTIDPAKNEGWESYQQDNLYSPAMQLGEWNVDFGGLFDKRQAYMWHSTYKDPYYVNETYGHYIQIKLTEPISNGLRFCYWLRTNEPPENPNIEGYAPSKIVVWYSTVGNIDNENSDTEGQWKELVTLTREADGLPYTQGDKMYYMSEEIDLNETITYLRFSCMEKTSDGETYYLGKDDGNNAFVAITEMKVWGN